MTAHTEASAIKSEKIILAMLMIVAGSAFSIAAYAENTNQVQMAKSHHSIFQAAAEVLHKNPHAADLPVCTSNRNKSAELCIRNPAIEAQTTKKSLVATAEK